MSRKRSIGKPLARWQARDLHEELYGQHGPFLGGSDLARLLGYPSAAALRQAELRNTLPVSVFGIENRRGRFAFTEDVADWLANIRHQTRIDDDDKEGGAASQET